MPIQTAIDSISNSQGSPFGFKNRIINGGMVIDQRNAGSSVTANGALPVDRFRIYVSQSSKLTAQQNLNSITPPAGFTNYVGISSSSAYSVTSSDFFLFGQVIEGYNMADLAWGTSTAKPITISFWARSSLTGTFGGYVKNGNSNRTYPFTYTINQANTWEKETITIPGDKSGTWLTTNGQGLLVFFSLGSGSSVSYTAGSWQAVDGYGATGGNSVVGTNAATWYIAGLQVENGTQATEFDWRPYTTEFELCQRYYETLSVQIDIAQNGGSYCYGNWFFKVTKRTQPTVTQSGLNIGGQNTIQVDGAQWYASSAALRVTAATASAEL